MSAIENGLALRASIRSAADATIGRTLGSFIAANPANVPRVLQPAQAGYRRACEIYARTGAVGQAVTGYLMGAACDPYLGSNAPVFTPSPPAQGFSGGQCPGVTYLINGEGKSEIVNQLNVFITTPYVNIPVVGPVTKQFVSGTDSNGRQFSRIIGLSNGQPWRQETAYDGRQPTMNFSVTRADGQADNCGNPPAPPPPGYNPRPTAPVPGPPDFPYTPPGGGPTININVGSPTINLDGTLSLPINIGGVPYDGLAGEPGSPSAPPPDGPDLDSPGTPTAPPPGENEVDEDSPVACVIVRTTTVDDSYGYLVLGQTQKLYQPPLGYIRFKFNNGSHTEWVEITDRDQLVCYCCTQGEPVEAAGYYLKWAIGNTGSATPIRLKSSS